MANVLFPKWKQALMEGASDSSVNQDDTTNGPYLALIDTADYTYSSAHEFYSSAVAGEVGTPQRIDNPTCTNGVFDGADCTFSSVSGDQFEAGLIYRKNSGANTTWRMVMYADTSQTGLPITPNGGNITVTWNVSGIFGLCDIRVKENIKLIGKCGWLNVYSFNYKGSKQMQVGFMAQEVEQAKPDCVTHTPQGLLLVNYGKLLKGDSNGRSASQ